MSDNNSSSGSASTPVPSQAAGPAPAAAPSQQVRPTNANTAALLSQVAQRWGFVASLANPLAGLALSTVSSGLAPGGAPSTSGISTGADGTNGATSTEGGGGADASAMVAAAASSGSLLETVLGMLAGNADGTGGGGLTPSLRLLVLGFIIAYARQLLDNTSSLLRRFFVTTVELSRDSGVPSWYWIEHLFRKVDLGKRLNVFTVESHSNEEDEAIARGQDVPLILGLPTECELSFFLNARTGRIYPSFFDALTLRNRSGGKLLRFVRRLRLACMRVFPWAPHAITYGWLESRKETTQSIYGGDKMVSQLSTISRSRLPLEAFIKHARFVYARDHTSKTRVYVSDPINREWDCIATRPKRLFSSVLLEGRTQEALLHDIRAFLSRRMREFYSQRGVPHRRGLLYGPPGSGKTSSIVAIAGELNLNVYALSLAQKGMDERLLLELANDCETPSILLLEDIDAAFTGRVKTSTAADEEGDSQQQRQKQAGADGETAGPANSTVGSENRVTFSALLQLLDGAASSENRIVFATTNHIERLDAALIRPGRIDVKVQYHNASRRQAKGLFLRIFTTLSAKELDERLIEARRTYEEAVAHHAAQLKDGDDALLVGTKDDNKLNGNARSGESAPRLRLLTTTAAVAAMAGDKAPLRLKKRMTDEDFEEDIFHPDLIKLAKEFAAQIPERQLSMAQLQGFLIKRAMMAQQESRARKDQKKTKSAADGSKNVGGGAEGRRAHAAADREEKKEDGISLGVKAETESEELWDMLAAARRAVADIAAFVEHGADDAEVGVSI
ncbi:hypothetical protein V8E36_002896 [Tilletia maclaganii]